VRDYDVSEKDGIGMLGLTQLVIFLVIKLIHLGLNLRFDIGVVFMSNYFFSERRRPHQ
jgi:hypothetical protein